MFVETLKCQRLGNLLQSLKNPILISYFLSLPHATAQYVTVGFSIKKELLFEGSSLNVSGPDKQETF